MDREIIDFPDLFRRVLFDWNLDVRGRSAGDGVTGDGQVVYAMKAKWSAKMDVLLAEREHILAWRAIFGRVRGRVNIIRINVNDPFRVLTEDILDAGDVGVIEGDGVPHDDDAMFDDGTGYSYEPTAPVLSAGSMGATSLLIDGSPIYDQLAPGMYFSIDDWLYLCTGIEGEGASTSITFEPPLRRPASTADSINLNASVLMVMVQDVDGMPALDVDRVSKPTFDLVEWTNRP